MNKTKEQIISEIAKLQEELKKMDLKTIKVKFNNKILEVETEIHDKGKTIGERIQAWRIKYLKNEIGKRSEKLKAEIEKIEKGCGFQETHSPLSLCKKDNLCSECSDNLKLIKLGAKLQKEKDVEMIDRIKKRIMINGNLSNRIIECDGEFEHKHDFVLNEIVCEIIDEELKQEIMKEEKNE